ncbi:HEPN-associated N-terminal domain-containing protein [Streptomyces nogalater]
MWQTQTEQGWDDQYGYVCAGCVDDESLAAKIRADADDEDACDYCERTPAAPIDSLLEAFFDGLRTEYALAGDESAYFEGELVPTRHWDGPDLVDCHAEVLRGEELQATVRDAARYDDVWVERDFIAPREDEALLDGWQRFSHQVKYRTRNVFWLAPPDRDEDLLGGGEIRAADVLETLGRPTRSWPRTGAPARAPAVACACAREGRGAVERPDAGYRTARTGPTAQPDESGRYPAVLWSRQP